MTAENSTTAQEKELLDKKKRTLKLVLAAGLKGARIRLKLTQGQLAEKAGVTPRTICMLESKSGASCSMDTFLAVASVLNMRVLVENASVIQSAEAGEVRVPKRVVSKRQESSQDAAFALS